MTTTSEAIVGFEDETEKLMQRLIFGTKHLDVVSIVGMPGIGKTTLAKRLYTHHEISGRFDICSWCTISQVYNKRETLLELLDRTVTFSGNAKSDAELADDLRKHLLKKKYLIVIDDLWSTEVWYDLKRCFPNDNCGSRIILTTRQGNMASDTKVFSDPHHLRLFTDEESWCLLQKKVFGEDSCPPKLVEIGLQIVQSCRGLPLAIILVAGLLANLDKEKRRHWKKVANDLISMSCLAGDTQKYMDVIELSFKCLPELLQLCFRFFGRYFEGEILVRELIQLWVAEEFPADNNIKITEDIAEGCLMELIDSNLVMVVRKNFFGKVKEIRMHDLLREFCWTRTREEISLLGAEGSDYSSYARSGRDFVVYKLYQPEGGIIHPHMIPSLRSVITLWHSSSDIINLQEMFFDCNSLLDEVYKSLRVLDLTCYTITGTSSIAFQSLIHLRYLALKRNFEEPPSWLSNLKNLETLILVESRDKVDLSRTIWDMVSLKHLEVTVNPAIIMCMFQSSKCTVL